MTNASYQSHSHVVCRAPAVDVSTVVAVIDPTLVLESQQSGSSSAHGTREKCSGVKQQWILTRRVFRRLTFELFLGSGALGDFQGDSCLTS